MKVEQYTLEEARQLARNASQRLERTAALYMRLGPTRKREASFGVNYCQALARPPLCRPLLFLTPSQFHN